MTATTPDTQTQDSSDPNVLVDALSRATGARPGHRVSHPKGVLLSGTFTPSGRAEGLTTAAHLQGDPVRVTVRFSNASTDPHSNDAELGQPRGMSVKFYLPDGSTTDIICQSWPVFVVSTPQQFLDFMNAQLESPEAVGAFIGANPDVAAALELIGQVSAPPQSWATMAFHSSNAFYLVAADGRRRAVRWTFVPEAGEHGLSEAEAAAADPDYLMTEIVQRLPVRFSVTAVLADDGDAIDDPTVQWPADRERVDLGTVELTAPDTEREQGGDVLVMDALRLTPGIEPSDDPILAVRSRAYSVSVEGRTGVARPDSLR